MTAPRHSSPASAIYRGHVVHDRVHPRRHRFRHDVAMLYLDLDEIERGLDRLPLFSSDRPTPLRFRDRDYLPHRDRSLADTARDCVEDAISHRPDGAVRLLTQVRTFGHVFNPVSFYFCHDATDEHRPVATVAEITNTPWKERHCYVVDHRDAPHEGEARASFDKAFHVSPFFEMDQLYRWRVGTPSERLHVHMENLEDGRSVFTAALKLRRRPLRRRELARMLAVHPWITLRIVGAIHWQALRLWWKGVPFVPHPSKRVEPGGGS